MALVGIESPAVKAFVVGSNSSVEASGLPLTSNPPAINTFPFAKRVAVWYALGVIMSGNCVQLPVMEL
jgi:hypothetical protein